MKNKNFTKYATWEEKRFIDNLGSYRGDTIEPKSPRPILLQGLKRGYAVRTEWDELNKAEIIAHLNVALMHAGANPRTI